MNLGQMMLVVAALSLLGILILNANSTMMETTDIQNESEFGITAVSLATSIVEESMGKMFDAVIADTNNTLTDSTLLTPVGGLGHSVSESYRGNIPSTTDFNDFDDFDNLFLVFKSDKFGEDSVSTPGSDYEIVVPGIRSKYFVRTEVDYVRYTALNTVSGSPTWHKRILITVTRPVYKPTRKDTLVFPAIMSFWN